MPDPVPQQDDSSKTWLIILLLVGFLLFRAQGCPINPVNPVDPAPIAEPGLHVLVLYDSTKLRDIPIKQLSAVNSNRVPEYVSSKAGKFARFDITVTEQKTIPEVWKQAIARPRTSLPWVIISNAPSKGGTEEVMPPTDEDFLTLVKRYGE